MINNPLKSDILKNQLAIAIVSSKDTDEKREMHSKGDIIEILNHNEADDVIEELFESLLNRYQIQSKTSTKVNGGLTLILLTCCVTNLIN